ncbi:MAG: hypothetical protein OXP66_06175 [Candidatus Tectomicrobia bacterium]|nr:hypothetical protein [Candidatus Tectomicrobia bacterium]
MRLFYLVEIVFGFANRAARAGHGLVFFFGAYVLRCLFLGAGE